MNELELTLRASRHSARTGPTGEEKHELLVGYVRRVWGDAEVNAMLSKIEPPSRPVLDFTEASIDAITQSGHYRDEVMGCLYLRVSSTSKTFRWSGWSKADKVPMNVSLGRWPAMTVDAARAAAKQVDVRITAGKSLRKRVVSQSLKKVLKLVAVLTDDEREQLKESL